MGMGGRLGGGGGAGRAVRWARRWPFWSGPPSPSWGIEGRSDLGVGALVHLVAGVAERRAAVWFRGGSGVGLGPQRRTTGACAAAVLPGRCYGLRG